jgi:hypothetical protein
MKEQIAEMTKVLVDYTKENHIMASHVILTDYAEQLYKAGYRKQEWISVDERLPSKSGKYICCTTKGTILIERFYQLDDGGWFSNHKFCTVTHWMPLPEAPKMKGGAE